jgi:hypothetical protein
VDGLESIGKLKALFAQPAAFFKGMARQEFGASLRFCLPAIIVSQAISWAALLFLFRENAAWFEPAPRLPSLPFALACYAAGLAVFPAVLHFVSRLLGGTGSWKKTFQAFYYVIALYCAIGAAAAVLFALGFRSLMALMLASPLAFLSAIGVVGIVSMLLELYMLYLLVTGLSAVHGISKLRALFAPFIAAALLAVITLWLLVASAMLATGSLIRFKA